MFGHMDILVHPGFSDVVLQGVIWRRLCCNYPAWLSSASASPVSRSSPAELGLASSELKL